MAGQDTREFGGNNILPHQPLTPDLPFQEKPLHQNADETGVVLGMS